MATKKQTKKSTALEQPKAVDEVAATHVEPVEDTAPQVVDGVQDQSDILNQLQLVADAKPDGMEKAIRTGRFRTRQADAIHTNDGTAAVDQEKVQRNSWAIKIYQSYINKTVMTGTVMSVQPAFDRKNVAADKMRYIVTVQAGPYLVYIPDDQFAEVDFADFAEHMGKPVAQAVKIYLESRIGATINYVVTKVPPKGTLDDVGIVGGSRMEALVRQRARFWYGTQANGSAYINMGDKCRVRIISVSALAIRVELFGAECPVPNKELDYAMITDCRSMFEVGQELDAVITDIKRAPDNTAAADKFPVDFQVSVKRAKKDPRDAAMKMFGEGSKVKGTVSYIRTPTPQNPNARPAVFVKLQEGVQVQCPFPNGAIGPSIGASAFVTITNINREKKYLFGTITHFGA